MVLDIILGVIIIAQIGLFYWRETSIIRERREVIQAILAKSATEFSTAVKITEPVKEKEELEDTSDIPSDLTPESEVPQEEWLGAIAETNKD